MDAVSQAIRSVETQSQGISAWAAAASGLTPDELHEIYRLGAKISPIVNISPGVPNQQNLELMVPKSTISRISAKLSSTSKGFATRGRKLEREDPTDTAGNMRRSQRDMSRDFMDSETGRHRKPRHCKWVFVSD